MKRQTAAARSGVLVIVMAATTLAHAAHAPRLPAAALREDLAELVRLLDESHPDPYAHAGGRVAFYRQVHTIETAIPPGGLSTAAFLKLLRPLVAAVGDGHTAIGSRPATRSRFWLDFDVVGARLHVRRVYREADRPLLGAVVHSVEGVAFAEVVRRMQRVRGFDNDIHNLVHLADALSSPAGLAELLHRDEAPAQVTLELLVGGHTRRIVLRAAAAAPGAPLEPPSAVRLPALNAADLGWGFVDERRRVAILRIASAMRYREAFEVWRSTGFVDNLGAHLTTVASAATGGRPPATIPDRIAAVPSVTETIGALVAAMRAAGARSLIVDVRDNGGGNSCLESILEFFLYGPEAMVRREDGYQIPRYSELYFANYRNATRRPGGFDFAEEDAWRRRTRTGPTPDELSRKRETLVRGLQATPTFARVFRAGAAGLPAPPRVIVLTSARTYSAGFDIVTMLYRHGAQVVGVPSAQAGNCFIDTLGFRLRHSGLGGTISFKRSLAFPDDPRTGRLLQPHVELTYERLAALGFDPHAAVRLALAELARE